MCFDSNLNKLAVKSILGNTGEQFEFGPCSGYNSVPLSSPKYIQVLIPGTGEYDLI